MLLTACSLTACSGAGAIPDRQPENQGGGDGSGEEPDQHAPGGRYLVLYASRTGNTERVAQLIRTTLGCDILEVEPETPYDDDYDAMLERSQEELAAIRRGVYPPVKTAVGSFDDYDIVFVGYPIWYGSMATPMQTFLHTHASELAGKRIALFATSGSSGMSASVVEARGLCPGATVIERTLLLTSSTISRMETDVPEWLEEIGAGRKEPDTPGAASLKASITVGGRTITATMEDNAAGRDFISRLPLEVMLEDYGDMAEKIFYPDPALSIDGVPRGCAPVPGDITIYAPWSNVAIFCKSRAYGEDLIKIGRIDGNGIGALNVHGDISVRIEKL